MKDNKDRRIRVRAIRRNPTDLKKLSRALIQLALEQTQAEVDAQAEHQEQKKSGGPRRAA